MRIRQSHASRGFSLDLPVTFLQEGKNVIAYTPALDLSTSGKNVTEAKKRFVEIVRIFIDDLIENNTVEPVLHSLGWTRAPASGKNKGNNWRPPQKFISQEEIVVSV